MNVENVEFFKKNKDLFLGRNIKVGGIDIGPTVLGIVPIEVIMDMRPNKEITHKMMAENILEEFGPNSFDGVICMNMIEHCENWIEAMRNMWGCLKIGGHFILTTCTDVKGRHNYPNDYWRFTLDDLHIMTGGTVIDEMNLGRNNAGKKVWIGSIGKKISRDYNISKVKPSEVK